MALSSRFIGSLGMVAYVLAIFGSSWLHQHHDHAAESVCASAVSSHSGCFGHSKTATGCPTSSPAHACVAKEADTSSPPDSTDLPENQSPESPSDDHDCMACQFLAERSVSAVRIDCEQSAMLVGSVDPRLPRKFTLLVHLLPGSRAPPA